MLLDGDDEADTDSGLSLDFSYSPASPCASEASYYSSSSSSASNSSSSSISDAESPFYEDKEEDAEEGLFVSDMEVEVTIKQEELDEEEMGAVGGGYPEDMKKLLPVNYGDHKLLNGFTWLEQIDHDHTYNQPLPSASSPSHNIPTKHKNPLRNIPTPGITTTPLPDASLRPKCGAEMNDVHEAWRSRSPASWLLICQWKSLMTCWPIINSMRSSLASSGTYGAVVRTR